VYIRCVNKCIKNNQYYEHLSHPTLSLPPLHLRHHTLPITYTSGDGVGATTVWGGSSVHNTGCSLYIYLQHYTTYIYQVSSYTSDHFHRSYPSPLFFPAASARVVLWPIDARGC